MKMRFKISGIHTSKTSLFIDISGRSSLRQSKHMLSLNKIRESSCLIRKQFVIFWSFRVPLMLPQDHKRRSVCC